MMKALYTRELTVLPSMCDYTGALGIPDTFSLFMDAATEHAEVLHIGMNSLIQQGLFWLAVRSKARFLRRPRLTEQVRIVTWPETPERSRCNRDYVVEAGGETLIEGKTEWMLMNMKNHRLYPVDRVFPPDMEIEPRRVLPEPFLRLPETLDGAEAFGRYTVRSTDIDIGGHMNNAAYLRALAGAFSTEQWSALQIHELEVSYRIPCFEGQVLDLEKKATPEGLDIRMGSEGKSVLLARIH